MRTDITRLQALVRDESEEPLTYTRITWPCVQVCVYLTRAGEIGGSKYTHGVSPSNPGTPHATGISYTNAKTEGTSASSDTNITSAVTFGGYGDRRKFTFFIRIRVSSCFYYVLIISQEKCSRASSVFSYVRILPPMKNVIELLAYFFMCAFYVP